MRDFVILFVHLIATVARLAGPGGIRSLVAESVLVKHQLLILNRSRKRAPNLLAFDRIAAGLCALLMRPAHHPFRNRIETFNSHEPPPRPEDTKIPPPVLAPTEAQTRATRTQQGTDGSI